MSNPGFHPHASPSLFRRFCAEHGGGGLARIWQSVTGGQVIAVATEPKISSVEKERYKLCPSCGYFVGFAEAQSYCIICGTRLIEGCPDCLEPIIYPVARFCPVCGKRLVKGNAPGENSPAFPEA